MQQVPTTTEVDFEFRSWRGVRDTTLCDKVCQCLVAGQWFSVGTPVSFSNTIDRNNITEILLKVMLNTINPTPIFIALKIICETIYRREGFER